MAGDPEDIPPRPELDDLRRRVAKARIAEKLFATDERVTIGRYQLLEMVGEGGMSVVWGAWDPELERRVAIKLVKATAGSTRERIVAEGQALAKLSHPNVVPVFDVGIVDDRVYLVMEWVRGKNLREWCDDTRREDRATVAVYRAAAAGLVAAHDAGLVHRDFKPDNAVVGDDGRVRVLDFGLASSETPRTGVIGGGTPRYMAPEQLAGGEITAAVDQYAFGVSLREALGPSGSVPAWIAAILARATATAPSDRFGSMAELVAALDRDPRTVWRRRTLVGAALALSGGAFAVGTMRSDAPDPCGGGEAEIATSWSRSHADAVQRAAGADGPAAVQALDAWAQRWASEHRAVCTAGQGGWSSRLFDRGLSCLATRRQRFVSTIELLESTHHGTGIDLVDRLPDPQPCSDPAYLEALVAPPDEPVRAAAVRALQANIAYTNTIARAGQVQRATTLAGVFVQQAATLGYPPLLPQARLLTGSIAMHRAEWDRAYEELHEAYFGARSAGDPQTAADAATNLTVVLLNTSRDNEAREWARLAVAEATSTNDPMIEVHAARAQVLVAHDTSDVANVVAYADRFLAVSKRQGQALALPLMERGRALHLVGRLADALAAFDAASEDAEKRTAIALRSQIQVERSLVLIEMQRPQDALVAARAALAIVDGKFDPNSQTILGALSALAVALGRTNQLDEALTVFDRSLAIERATEGDHSYNTASDLHNRAEILARLDRFDEAFASWDEAKAIFIEVDGPHALDVGKVELGYAMALLRAGKRSLLASHAETAVAVFAKTPEHAGLAMAHIALGLSRVEARDWPHAKALLEQGLAAIDDVHWRAQGDLGLAMMNAETGNSERAKELATAALVELRADPEATRQVTEAEALLARLH